MEDWSLEIFTVCTWLYRVQVYWWRCDSSGRPVSCWACKLKVLHKWTVVLDIYCCMKKHIPSFVFDKTAGKIVNLCNSQTIMYDGPRKTCHTSVMLAIQFLIPSTDHVLLFFFSFPDSAHNERERIQRRGTQSRQFWWFHWERKTCSSWIVSRTCLHHLFKSLYWPQLNSYAPWWYVFGTAHSIHGTFSSHSNHTVDIVKYVLPMWSLSSRYRANPQFFRTLNPSTSK